MRIIILDFASSNSTVPSLSAKIAGLEGRRTSNNSSTRGKPPVISPAFVVWTGVLANTSPAFTLSPFLTIIVANVGNKYSAFFLPELIISPFSFTNKIAGFKGFFDLPFQSITFAETIPVVLSTSS